MSRDIKEAMHPPILDVKLNQEFKYFDAVGAAAVAVAGTIVDLCAPAQGVSGIQRVGDEIALRALQLGFVIKPVSAVAVATVRVIIVRWQADNSAIATTITSVINATGASSAVVPYNYQTSRNGLFSIVFDQSYAVAVIGTQEPIIVKRELNLKGTNVRFGPGATTGEGKIFMFVIGDSATPTLDYSCRLIYDDSA